MSSNESKCVFENTTVQHIPQDETEQDGLRKTLKDRHLSMIALGGALGTGLLVGT